MKFLRSSMIILSLFSLSSCSLLSKLKGNEEEKENTEQKEEEVKKYVLTFDYGYGGTKKVYDVAEGETIDYPANPLRPGYNFGGWDYDGKTMPGNDLTIKAIWVSGSKYKLTFVFNNGQEDQVSELNGGDTIKYPGEPTDSSGQKTFVGWEPAITRMPEYDTFIVAMWKNVDQNANVTMTFNLNGGSYEHNSNKNKKANFSFTGKPGSVFNSSIGTAAGYITQRNYFKKDNHQPIGWAPSIPTTFPLADTSYYYQWQEDPKYLITFVLDNGQNNITYQLYEGQTIEFPEDPKKKGYRFDGWDTDLTKMPAENIIVKAKWIDADKYTLTFVTGFGTENSVSQLKEGGTIVYPSNPSDTAKYKFKGWDNDVTVMPAQNLTISAVWEYSVKPGAYKQDVLNSDDPGDPEVSFENACSANFNIDNNGVLTRTSTSSLPSTVSNPRQYILVFPNTVKSLGTNVFSSLSGVIGVDLRATQITHVPAGTFTNNYNNGTYQYGGSNPYANQSKNTAQYLYLPSTVQTMESGIYSTNDNPSIYTYFDKDRNSVMALKSYATKGISFYYMDVDGSYKIAKDS